MASEQVASYYLSNIKVTITETDREHKLLVDCNDGDFHSSFEVSRYEYKNYKRHMNQRIKNAFNRGHAQEE